MARPQFPWLLKNVDQFIFNEWTRGGEGITNITLAENKNSKAKNQKPKTLV